MARETGIFGQDLLATKLNTPETGGSAIPRNRLLQIFEAHRSARVALITAPAGYGKTIALTQWWAQLQAEGRRCCWVSLDPSDNEPGAFFSYVWAAVSRAGISISGDDITDASSESMAASLRRSLAQMDEPLHLFLDDFHNITDPYILQNLAQTLPATGPEFHLIIAGRNRPSMPLGRLKATGQLFEIDEEDLKFRPSETETLFRVPGQPEISERELLDLTQFTEGWAVALRLTALSIRKSEPDDLIQRLAAGNRDLSEYMAEEIVQTLPENLRSFLLRTSVLERICPELCDAILGIDDSQKMIAHLEEANLFLYRLDADGKWWRYHHLFQDWLQKQLRRNTPGAEAEICERASRWFLEQRLYKEAVEAAIAFGKPQFLGDVLNACCHYLFHTGQHKVFKRAIELLPDSVIQNYPHLTIFQIWEDEITWNFEKARRSLRRLREKHETGAFPSETEASLQSESFEKHILHREMMLALMSDDVVSANRMCREWLDRFHKDNDYDTTTVENSLLYTQREMFHCKGALAEAARLRNACKQQGVIHGSIWLDSIAAPALVMRGEIRDAVKYLRGAVEVATELAGREAPLTAMPALLLAQTEYHLNNLETAASLLDRYGPVAAEIGFVEQLIAYYGTAIRLSGLRGDDESRRELNNECQALAAARGFVRLLVHATHENVRIELDQGQIENAVALTRDVETMFSVRPALPHSTATTKDALITQVWARLQCALGRSHETSSTLLSWVNFLERRGCNLPALEFLLLVTKVSCLQGENRIAIRHLRRALAIGAQTGEVRAFLDEGEPVVSLLAEISEQTEEAGTQGADANRYAGRLRAMIEHGYDAVAEAGDATALEAAELPQHERLSTREIEILRLVSRGITGRYIGKQLGITEGTVRWHLQQVFDKLGVRRRQAAVERARHLGLLKSPS